MIYRGIASVWMGLLIASIGLAQVPGSSRVTDLPVGSDLVPLPTQPAIPIPPPQAMPMASQAPPRVSTPAPRSPEPIGLDRSPVSPLEPLPNSPAGNPMPLTTTPFGAPPTAFETQSQPSMPSLPLFSYCPPGMPQFWSSLDYLLWWTQQTDLPPIAQVIPDALANAPAFRAGQAMTLYPTDSTGTEAMSGIRTVVGGWFSPAQTLAAEVVYFQLFEQGDRFQVESNGSPVIGRYYVDSQTNLPTLLTFSNPTTGTRGSISADFAQSVHNAEANLMGSIRPYVGDRMMVIAGFRYMDVQQRMNITDRMVNANGSAFIQGQESFDVKNRFYGGQVGTKWVWQGKHWSLDTTVKLAVGAMSQNSEIQGMTMVHTPANTATYAGDILAQSSNIGNRTQTTTALIPELNLKLGYKINSWAQFHAGYDFVFISDMMNLGNLMDTTVNANLIPPGNPGGPMRPGFPNESDTFWLQGLTLGVSIQY
ncbi:BBP7 family outer membrane beta-barrel protein [Tuwongella immobilis]|uniref:Uncharacterized protein n=1 Tax=Tuwongella immobilis TaxID=692036 RepID=A0A6C2YTT2_9BACT|nr:BBP7 family outer membrane beta-barrel protein [Tuwongella immobilis]VIP05050.1 Protein containing DUF1551 OS=Rhodopirellula maiorica SM1 GN=RMSM_05043 PE=4 SV=1: DUF1551 [Tuwongella immobilis]VTS07456.1 Protein containing DUF1551 OS=Rhodopirellula maiorica SM1 GN=RMSM_05043 PE=4 SV=1: DUF1551 [Tuwongella immobilis]